MPRSGLDIAVTGTPAACRPATTPFHDELSAKAPCTRATVGPVGATMLASDMRDLLKEPPCSDALEASDVRAAAAPVDLPGQTRISPSSDQSSCGTEKLTIRGVSARCGGNSCCAALKCSDCTCAAPASSSRKASTSTYSFGSSRLRDQSNHRQPASARVASVKPLLISGQVSASSGRTRNLAVMNIIEGPFYRLPSSCSTERAGGPPPPDQLRGSVVASGWGACRGAGTGGPAGNRGPRSCEATHASATSATSRQPLSMVSEWPRSGNSCRSVTAAECRYLLHSAWVTEAGIVRSLPPAMSSSGPRISLAVSTVAGECGLKLAAAASHSGLPGDGIAHRSWSSSDSSRDTALPNA